MSLVIFLRSSDWQSKYLAVTTAVTAAAMGDEVQLALFFGPLRDWVDGSFDRDTPPRAAEVHVGSLTSTLEEARRDLGVKIVACDTAMKLASVEEGQASRLDGIVSFPALWKTAQTGQLIAF
jgi:peroxiredoxin family protein